MDFLGDSMILLTVGQVSERLHIHPNTLRRWANQGKIPVWRFSSRGDRRFSEKDIDSYLVTNYQIFGKMGFFCLADWVINNNIIMQKF